MAVNLVMKMLTPPAGSEPQFSVDIERSATVAELKEQIAERAGLPKEQIRLVCAGRVWQDNATVGSYEPADGVIVHLLHDAPRNQPASSSQVLRPTDPLAQMMSDSAADGMFGGPNNLMSQSQQMMMQNPEMLQELMKMPLMKQMMSDPETVRALMRMNPQLNQLMEQRPEIARLLDDPEVFKQSMQMVANPSLMREMTRNADRAIGQLDALPGGHNALVRAHEEFADPLYQALSGSDGSGGGASAATYEDQTQGAPNNEALPNPWGAPQPQSTPAASTTPAAATAPTTAAPTAGTAPAMGTGLGGFGNMGLGGAMGGGTAPGGGSNPMAAMMQNMMQNPQQMQQMMQLSQQLMGGGGLGGGTTPAATGTAPATTPTGAAATPPASTSPTSAGTTAAPENPFMAMMQQRMAMMQNNTGTAPSAGTTGGTAPPMNPMAAAMQQLMNNPAQMQQSMMLAQQMFGGGAGTGLGGGMGNVGGAGTAGTNPNPFGAFLQSTAAPTQPQAGSPQAQAGGGETASTAAANPFLRNRFASQLQQLREMGFENEAVCIQVLTQHNGRVDLALDTLFGMGDAAR